MNKDLKNLQFLKMLKNCEEEPTCYIYYTGSSCYNPFAINNGATAEVHCRKVQWVFSNFNFDEKRFAIGI